MITASLVTFLHTQEEIKPLVMTLMEKNVDQLYIVDNSPKDTLRPIEQISDKIKYIHNKNTGYGSAHNIALREAIRLQADYHIVINPDIRIEQDTIQKLKTYMDARPEIGLVMPNVVYPNGEQQYLCKLLPTPMDLFLRRFLSRRIGEQQRARFELRFTGYNREMDVPFLSGCFMFLRVSALCEVGLFDERYFMYGEDIDLSRRIHARFRTVFYPGVTIIHAHEAASYKNKKMLFIHIRNIVRYFNKWGWFWDRERKRINRMTLEKLLQTKPNQSISN